MSTKEKLELYIKTYTKFVYNGSVYVLKVDDGEIWMHLHNEDSHEVQVNLTHYSSEGYDFQLFHGYVECVGEFSIILKTLKID